MPTSSVRRHRPAPGPRVPEHHRRGPRRAGALRGAPTTVAPTLLTTLLTGLVTGLVTLAAPPASAAGPALGDCGAGQLCFWEDAGFLGSRRVYELAGTALESCVPLPKGMRAHSFANRMGRPVTVYQSAHCDTTGEFATHPSGSWTPEGAYAVRAFTVWEH